MGEKARKILIVEDEPDVMKYLNSLLTDNGFTVMTATDGKEGMEIAGRESPDLISLDITMPNESGVRMLRNLHDEPSTSSIPVVIVTGVDPQFKDFIEKRKQVNPPTAYFEKPINQADYIAKIKEILGSND